MSHDISSDTWGGGHSTGQQEFIISLFGSWMSKSVRSSSPKGNRIMAHCLRHASMITSIKFTTQDEASVGYILCCLVPNEEGIWRQKVKDSWKKNGKKKNAEKYRISNNETKAERQTNLQSIISVSMEHRHFLGAHIVSTREETFCIWCKLTVNERIHRIQPFVPLLIQINPVHVSYLVSWWFTLMLSSHIR